MVTRRLAMATCLLLAPMAAIAGGRSLTVHIGGCKEPDLAADVVYAADRNAGYLRSIAVAVSVDASTRQCGYALRKGREARRLKSGLTDIELREQLARFFADTANRKH